MKTFFKKIFIKFSYFVKGLKFKRADSDKEKELVFKIRHDVYHEMGYIPKTENNLFIDDYDDYSVHFLCYRWDKPIACMILLKYGWD